MYTEKDSKQINAMWGRFLLISLVGVLACAALLAWALKERWMWFGYAVCVVAGLVGVFCWGMVGSRIRAYRRFIRELVTGRESEARGRIESVEEKPGIRNGLEFYTVNLISENEKTARTLFFDAAKGKCPAEAGQQVACKLYGMYIKDMIVL